MKKTLKNNRYHILKHKWGESAYKKARDYQKARDHMSIGEWGACVCFAITKGKKKNKKLVLSVFEFLTVEFPQL
jgi:hypothetical protein